MAKEVGRTAFVARWAYRRRGSVLNALTRIVHSAGRLAGVVRAMFNVGKHAYYDYADPGPCSGNTEKF